MATLSFFEPLQRFAQTVQKASKAASASTAKVLASFTRSRSCSPPKHEEKKKQQVKLSKREELANLLDQDDSFSSFVAAGSADSAIKPIVNSRAATAVKLVAKPLSQEALKSAEMAKHKLIHVQKEAVRQRALFLANLLQQSRSSLVTAAVCSDIACHLADHPEAVEFYSKLDIVPILLKEILRCEKSSTPQKQVVGARRCLALMGYAPPVKGPGVRILTLDGGGMRGLALIEVLKQLEKKVGQPLNTCFDYVMGASTGGIIVLLHFLLKTPLQECEEMYLDLGTQLFTRDRVIGTSKLLLNQAFYDSELWEKVLKNRMEGGTFSDFAGNPTVAKIAILSSVVTETFLCPFAFRNYNTPSVLESESSVYPLLRGSAKYKLWQGCRAGSAAPFYYEEFKLDGWVHMDGGLLANNPTAYALHEAALLWPSEETSCIVSVGTGRTSFAWLPTMPSNTSSSTNKKIPLEEIGKQSLNDLAKSPSLRQKIVNLVQAATDTEVTHSILAGSLSKNKYFRLNPFLTEQVNLDENRLSSLAKLQADAQRYAELNDPKFQAVADILTKPRSHTRKVVDLARIRFIVMTPAIRSWPLIVTAKVNATKENAKRKSLFICGAAFSKVSTKIAPVRRWMANKMNFRDLSS